MIAAKLATLQQGARTDLSPIGERSQATAAKALNVGKRSVERAKIVHDQGGPELIKAVEAGEVSVSAAVDSIRPRSPRPKSARSRSSSRSRPILTCHDVLGWLSTAPLDERRRVFDGAGERTVAESIPPHWDMILSPAGASLGEIGRLHKRIKSLEAEVRQRDLAIRELQRQLSASALPLDARVEGLRHSMRSAGFSRPPQRQSASDGAEAPAKNGHDGDGLDIPACLRRTPAETVQ